MRDQITEFERLSAYTAYQIGELSRINDADGEHIKVIDADKAAILRRAKRQFRRKQKDNPDTAVSFVIKQHLAGVTYRDIQKRFAHTDAVNRGKLLLKLARSGSNASEIAKAVKLPVQNVESILKSIKIEVKV